MNNISLLVTYPLLLIAGFAVFITLMVKEKMVKKTINYCVQTLMFWIVGGFLVANMQDQILNLYQINISTPIIILLYIFGILFFNMIFRPIFNLLIRYWIHSQKKLLIISSFLQIINFALVIYMYFSEVTVWLLVLNVILIGWLLALYTIQQIFFAEQHYYKISAISVSFFIGTVYLLGNAIGFYVQSLSNAYGTVVILLVTPIFGILLLASLIMVFKTSEDVAQSGQFGEDVLIELKPYKKRIGYKLFALALILGFVFAVNNSSTTMNLMIAFMSNDGISLGQIESSISLFRASIFLLPMIFSYPIYRLIFKRVGIYFSMMILATIMFATFLFLIFLHNGVVFLIMLMISNSMYFAIYQSIFGMSIAWHFRRKAVIALPGMVATGSILIKWLLDIVIAITDAVSDSFLWSTNKLIDQIKSNGGTISYEDMTQVNALGSLILLIGACMILVWFCLFQFWWKEVIADENDISEAQFKMKKIVQKTFISRAREQVTMDLINEEMSVQLNNEDFDEMEE